MEPLDGNAIAGTLFESFGREMTAVAGRCRHCDARSLIAELDVYARAPGAVARCRTCGSVVIVLVSRGGATALYADGFELPGSSEPGRSGAGPREPGAPREP